MFLDNFLKGLYWGLACVWSYSMSFVMSVSHFLIFTFVLVLCDMYSGIRKAQHNGEQVNSKGFRRSILKITLFFMAILLSKGMTTVYDLAFNLDYVVSGLIALSEFKSNLENISVITGIDFWSKLVAKFPSLSDFMPKKEDPVNNNTDAKL